MTSRSDQPKRPWAAIGIRAVRDKKLRENDRKVLIGWAFEAYREIYRQLLLAGNLEGAMKAVKELTALEAKHRILDEDEEAAAGQKANPQFRD